MALAEQAGLSELVAGKVAFTATMVASAGANPAGKLTAIVAGMAGGADSIDDLNIIRAGGMPRLFDQVYAPSTVVNACVTAGARFSVVLKPLVDHSLARVKPG